MGFDFGRDILGQPTAGDLARESERRQADAKAAEDIENQQIAENRRLGLTADKKLASGQLAGRVQAEKLYGMKQEEIGTEVSDIVKKRREALNNEGPQADILRQQRNSQLRMSKASGGGAAEAAQINRSSAMDIANARYGANQQNLNSYQKLIGNILGGSQSMEMGMAGLEKSAESVTVNSGGGMNGGMFGSVICSELFLQGYMPYDVWIKDQAYGKYVIRTNPDIYRGYLVLATPVVWLMKRSKLFTKLISIPAMKWAMNMAGQHNLVGSLISTVGEPICSLVGKTKRRLHATIQNANT